MVGVRDGRSQGRGLGWWVPRGWGLGVLRWGLGGRNSRGGGVPRGGGVQDV